MLSATEALERLQEGNHRFVSDSPQSYEFADSSRRHELVADQKPFAIVLGCSDSRVPAEIVFDQGLGDLFVIRVAGNIAAPSQIGSVEFAAEWFGTRLVVVLGHTRCGAVLATLQGLESRGAPPSENLRAIVDRVRPSVEPLLRSEAGGDREALIAKAVRTNVGATMETLRGSDVLARLETEQGLRVVGAEYSLETGNVEFFAGV